MLKLAMPEASSLPNQVTGKLLSSLDGRGFTELRGGALSTVLLHVCVAIGAFASKTTVAVFAMVVPLASPPLGATVKKTPASPSGGVTSGGRNPAKGSWDRFP